MCVLLSALNFPAMSLFARTALRPPALHLNASAATLRTLRRWLPPKKSEAQGVGANVVAVAVVVAHGVVLPSGRAAVEAAVRVLKSGGESGAPVEARAEAGVGAEGGGAVRVAAVVTAGGRRKRKGS